MEQVSRIQAESRVQIDNQSVRVTEWRFAPFAETGWHTHSMAYIVVPQTSGRLLLETREAEDFARLKAGESYYRPAGITHNVVNANEYEFVFIEVELKNP